MKKNPIFDGSKKRPIIRTELKKFAEAMETIMRVEDATKGDSWKRIHEAELYMMLCDEFREAKQSWNFDIDNFRKELVDISNFCMMLWNRLGDKYIKK